jgi:N-hydroxyarylamine O-acetyltransferase
MGDDANLPAYFERVGFSGSIAPTLKTLEALQFLHPAAIPFENIDCLIGRPIRLDTLSVTQKLVFEKRGGYCFEHNMLLLAALTSLDFKARPLAAEVLWNRDPAAPPAKPSHMLLLVEIGGTSYIADVGFGGATLTAPLRLKPDVEQASHNEPYRLMTEPEGGWRLEMKTGEGWRPVYRFDLAEQSFETLEGLSDKASLGPRLRDTLLASRVERGKRYNLENNRLTTHTIGESRQLKVLNTLAELRQTLTETFGIALPASDKLDPALSRFLPAPAAEAQAG